jgi:hypothetical protein
MAGGHRLVKLTRRRGALLARSHAERSSSRTDRNGGCDACDAGMPEKLRLRGGGPLDASEVDI